MEATIDGDKDLLERAERCAEESGTTLSALVEGALRRQVAEPEAGERTLPRLPSFSPSGPVVLPEGVTWDRISHIFDDDDDVTAF